MDNFQEISTGLIDPSSYQHRRFFDPDKLKELAKSIKRDGLIEPIVIRKMKESRYELIAGERRLRAVKIASLDTILCRVVLATDIQARRMCAAENLQREDLSPAEEVEAIVEMVDAEMVDNEYHMSLGDMPHLRVSRLLKKLKSIEEGKRQGSNPRGSSENVHKILNNIVQEIEKIFTSLPRKKDWLSFLQHDLPLLNLDDDVIDVGVRIRASKARLKALQKMKEKAPKAYKDLEEKVKNEGEEAKVSTPGLFDSGEVEIDDLSARDIEKITRFEQMEVVRIKHFDLDKPLYPEGKYRCIVIDPPWPIKKIEREERPNQGVELDYPTMTLDEIKQLPINDLAYSDGCHLYLWVTQKYLPFGLELVETWGFRYQCLMTWRKNVGMTPYSWMYDTEHVVFAKMGNLPLAQLGLRLSFDAKVSGHSVKPDAFFDDRVLLASPEPRLEMFARKEREGFAVWGNEINA